MIDMQSVLRIMFLYKYARIKTYVCACTCICTDMHTPTSYKAYLYKGNANSKMFIEEGATQSQKTKENRSVKAMFDTRLPC